MTNLAQKTYTPFERCDEIEIAAIIKEETSDRLVLIDGGRVVTVSKHICEKLSPVTFRMPEWYALEKGFIR